MRSHRPQPPFSGSPASLPASLAVRALAPGAGTWHLSRPGWAVARVFPVFPVPDCAFPAHGRWPRWCWTSWRTARIPRRLRHLPGVSETEI